MTKHYLNSMRVLCSPAKLLSKEWHKFDCIIFLTWPQVEAAATSRFIIQKLERAIGGNTALSTGTQLFLQPNV